MANITTRKLREASYPSPSVAGSSSSKDGEKTIPFLRRLADMLRENEEVVSFYPGVEQQDGKRLLGKIVVHDRARMESSILPRYFSHSSFASLRRQLNYFCFTRVGKGRQRGATYVNDAVVELDDILHLKRRPVGSTANIAEKNENLVDLDSSVPTILEVPRKHQEQQQLDYSLHSSIRNAVVPFVHLPRSHQHRSTKRTRGNNGRAGTRKKMRLIKSSSESSMTPPIISPLSTSPAHSDEESDGYRSAKQRLVLDLTVPPTSVSSLVGGSTLAAWRMNQRHFEPPAAAIEISPAATMPDPEVYVDKEEDEKDIWEGCSALLALAGRVQ